MHPSPESLELSFLDSNSQSSCKVWGGSPGRSAWESCSGAPVAAFTHLWSFLQTHCSEAFGDIRCLHLWDVIPEFANYGLLAQSQSSLSRSLPVLINKKVYCHIDIPIVLYRLWLLLHCKEELISHYRDLWLAEFKIFAIWVFTGENQPTPLPRDSMDCSASGPLSAWMPVLSDCCVGYHLFI